MNIIVTGAAGFLGSNLVSKLLKNQDISRILCIDNYYTGREKNLAEFKKSKRIIIKNVDLALQSNVMNDLVESELDGNLDRIYNFASPASPPQYQKDPINTIMSNFIGTKQMLDLAKKFSARLLQASTSEVYGDPLKHPQHESYFGNVNPVGPRACYDEAKRVCETLVTEYKNFHNVDTRMVRIFNTYGPNMSPYDGRVVSNFIVAALKGESLSVYGDGNQTRSFCYVDDLINGIVKLMEYKGSSDLTHTPFNIGNPKEFTMLELAEKVLLYSKSKAEISYKPLPVDDPKQRKPDITKAKEVLDWEPVVSLDSGLEMTIKYFSSALNDE